MMRGPKRQAGISAILAPVLAAVLAVAACTHQQLTPEARLKQGAAEMRSAITAAVSDPARRGQLIERADRLERVLAGYAVEYEAFEDKLHQANRGYDTPPAQIKALFTQFEQKRQAVRAQLLDLHFQMLALSSAEEWASIAKGEVRMLQVTDTLPPGTPEKKAK